MQRNKTRPENFHAQERRAFAVRMRQAGHTYRAIYRAAQQQFGATLPPSYNPRRVHADVVHVLQVQRNELDEHVEQVRVMELARLDALQVGLWNRAASGDTEAITVMLRIMHRQGAPVWAVRPGAGGPDDARRTATPGAHDRGRTARGAHRPGGVRA